MANKQKILIVDDDENIANLISLYLTKECYETRIEHDASRLLMRLKNMLQLLFCWILCFRDLTVTKYAVK